MKIWKLIKGGIAALLVLTTAASGQFLRQFPYSDFPYPSFPSTTIFPMQTTADFASSFSGTIANVASSDSPYGATAVEITFNGGNSVEVPIATIPAGLDITGGSIRFTFKPISGAAPSVFGIRLYSAGTPASPSANYITAGGTTFLTFRSTAPDTSNPGRYQSIGFPVNAFTAVGTGADTHLIKYALLNIRGSNGTKMQLGNIDYVPNPRTKAAVILRFDDGHPTSYVTAKPLMDAVGAKGFLAIGAINTVIGGGGHLNSTQLTALLAAGWQFGSQSYSTEDVTIVNGWTPEVRNQEYVNTRNYTRAYSHYEDSFSGTYYSSVGPPDMIAWPQLNANFQTLIRPDQGSPTIPPQVYSETFPPADPKAIQNLQLGSWGDDPLVWTYIQAALDQTRAAKGVLVISQHNDIDVCANCMTAFVNTLNYVSSTYPNEIEFVTGPRALIAPYNGDTMVNTPGNGPH